MNTTPNAEALSALCELIERADRLLLERDLKPLGAALVALADEHGATLLAALATPPADARAVSCVVCGSDEPYSGTCGSNDPRALCNATPPAAPATSGEGREDECTNCAIAVAPGTVFSPGVKLSTVIAAIRDRTEWGAGPYRFNTRTEATTRPSPSDAADKGDAIDMQALADLDDLADTLESWSRAYPLRMFPEPEPADLTWLHETKPGLCDRISASMGRHMAKHMSDAVTTMRTFINARAADNGETP